MTLRAFIARKSSELQSWFRAVSQRARLEREMQAELEHHLERLTADLIRAGQPAAEAARRARIGLGSALMHKEDMRASLGLRWLDELGSDLHYALRLLRKSPGFTAIAVGSLALGIGANTAIFTVAQHILLDRLNVPHPEQLRMLWWTQPNSGGAVEDMWGYFDEGPGNAEVSTSFSYPVYEQLRRQSHSMEEVFAFKPLDRQTVSVDGHAEADSIEMISGNYFSALSVQPQLGRMIGEADDVEGSAPTAVISDQFWTRHYGRTPRVIGKTILVNTKPLTIVGVAPRNFTGAYSAQAGPDLFFPFSMQPIVAPQEFGETSRSPSLLTDKRLWWVLVMGRAKPGVQDWKAEADLNVTMEAAVRATMPLKKDSKMPRLLVKDGSRGQNPAAEGMTKPLSVLLGVAGLVLLLACANLANLLLARWGARQREISVRLALGAGRGRVLRQSMTESLLLSFLGGTAGLLLAWTLRNWIPRLFSDSWAPPPSSIQFSWRIFMFAAVISILTGFVFGLAPAWMATKLEVSSTLKDSARTATRGRRGLGGKAIVAVQVALSMLLVVGAGLFVRTLTQLGHARLGFRSDHLMLFGVAPPQTRYSKAATIPLYRAMEGRVAAIPGVESVTLTKLPLISGNVSMYTFVPEGTARKPEGQNPSVLMNDVGASFFSTYRIPIIAGRGFDATDTETSRKVAVVNEALVKKYFPRVNPIGQTFDAGFRAPTQIEIVGVCADAKYDRVRKEPEPTFYVPYWQEKDGVGAVTFAVNSHMPAATLVPLLRRVVASVDANLPLLDIRTQDAQIAATMRNERILAGLTSGFGVLALLLACVGIYGVMAYSVAQRTNEIGIRLALGAQPMQVRGMVLRESTWITLAGIAAGVAGSIACTRLVRSMLYGVRPNDPATITAGVAVLLGIALVATWIPARRAASVQPMEALRHE